MPTTVGSSEERNQTMPAKRTTTTATPTGTYVVTLSDGTVFTVQASSPNRAEGVAKRAWVKAFGGPVATSVVPLDRSKVA